jgi:nitroreductase
LAGNNSIALTYLELAANGAGLGCCWAGLVYFMANNYQPMQEALDLPDGHVACGCMMLGYPASRYYRIPCRKTPRIIWRSPSENV